MSADRATLAGERPLIGRLAPVDVVRFTSLAALFAIFLDAALAHGFLWENDPYWTYWITKTFLLATVIGVGTAWAGIGGGRGAVIIAVQTVILTVYYWTLSPIGLPSHPEWLDLEHTWITGVPVHFSVLYLGYLSALWVWRRRMLVADGQPDDSAALATRAVVVAVLLVVLGGAVSSIAIGDFPGVTWFVVRILLTVPLLMFWWVWVGRDAAAAVTGSVLLAFVWAAYGHFLGPSGLPDTDLRLLDATPPPAPVRWLDYTELWLISFPVFIVVAVLVLLADSRGGMRAGMARTAAPAVLVAAVLATTGLTIAPEDRGTDATVNASGPVRIETGDWYANTFEDGTGSITIRTTNMGADDAGARVTPVPPHDRVHLEATIEAGGRRYEVVARKAMIDDPLGRHGTWWGVGYDVQHHGRTGVGSSKIPAVKNDVAGFALGEVSTGGRRLIGVPIHFMTIDDDPSPTGARLELQVGDPDVGLLDGLPAGHLRVLWPSYAGGSPAGGKFSRWGAGAVVLIVLLLAMGALNRRELARA